MSDDLVKRLRERDRVRGGGSSLWADIRQAADRIEALEAAGQWRPIETAPKDGTWFLIVNVDDDWPSMECGRYEPLMTDLFEEVGDGLYRKTRNSAYDWEGFSNFHRATHWFLIPQPPVPHD